MDLSVIEQLCFSTVRIETNSNEGVSYSGTGFFVHLLVDDKSTVPLLVTNKHVVQGMNQGKFIMSECDENGNPIYTKHVPINIEENFEKRWIFHPDPDIDLCVMPCESYYSILSRKVRKKNFLSSF